MDHNAIEAKRQMVRDLLNEMKGLRVFGVVDEQGKPLPKEGLIFAYRNRLIAVGKEVEDLGTFIPALSTMTLEEHCMDVWEEYFGNKEA